MPTYEYTCKNCGTNFEVFQSFTDKPLKKHKACGGELKKIFHARGIVFKGSGFYATDMKSSVKDAADGAPTDSKSDNKPKTDPKPEKSTEKKPEKKSAATA